MRPNRTSFRRRAIGWLERGKLRRRLIGEIRLARARMHEGSLVDHVRVRIGFPPAHLKVKWQGADNPRQAARALAKYARVVVTGEGSAAWVLSLGDGDEFHRRLNSQLHRERVPSVSGTLDEVAEWTGDHAKGVVLILSGYSDARRTTLAAQTFANHPILNGVRFEYASGLDREEALFAQLDEYKDTFFVSPVLLDEPNAYSLYEESLSHFEQKCGLRDFLDLYQLIKGVVTNDVVGDIVEFGSYRGHSGYLIATTLRALGSDKRLYMFDTFESFPVERLGLDYYWSDTHIVDFAAVQEKFRAFPNVHLIKGDFTETLATSGLGPIALAYVDCDSYRATRYLLDTLMAGGVSPMGILVCEDYGHPALLGNRVAVHEHQDTHKGWFHFFSQFSGLYISMRC